MRLIINPNTLLIDEYQQGRTTEWCYADDEEHFNKNKTRPDFDQVYLTSKIEYKFNSDGYRTKEYSSLDKDFVLAFGCSHTEGVGLRNEDVWINNLCDKIGIDRCNLGKGGSGPDIQYINTLQYIKNKYPMPKLVIYQWPQSVRKSFGYYEDGVHALEHYSTLSKHRSRDYKWFVGRYSAEPGEYMINNYIHYTQSNMLWKMLGVPVVNWTFAPDFELPGIFQPETRHDHKLARDMAHNGIKDHHSIADQLIPLVKEKL